MLPSGNGKLIGYFGFPRRDLLSKARKLYGSDLPLVDLDLDLGAPESGLLPRATCRIILNIMDNAVALGDRLSVIVAAVGEDKCDAGRNTAFLLRGMGFDVIESRFTVEDFEDREPVWCKSKGPLADRIDRIMNTVIDPSPPAVSPERCEPSHGFWGVPPNDFRILELFPPTTHLYGWIRCVEAGRPSDLDLEYYVDPGVPTVFFTQSFCAKQNLAHYLAETSNGIAVDCHREINDSILAKVEAFIRLS
ncbi:MAG TPA: hypothetical protein VLA34_12095 [Candidatus Krumholzibacterium sp.]|nr:hypothetical protein [Candidatus Krumholzibacterium sp.]